LRAGRAALARFGRRLPVVELVVGIVALVPRIGYVLANGPGYGGTFEYDASVYYASSAAVLHGRLPYADFVLVHPPGITIVLLPFAWLGSLAGDQTGFVAAQVAFAGIGALNAGLVARIVRRLGYGTRASVIGGLVYALWPGATGAEFASRLEPLGNLAVLLGLLAYLRAERSGRAVPAALCGAGFAFAASVKLWWVAFLVVILVWHLSPGRRPRLRFVLGGALATLLLVDGPFFAVAPRRMLSLIGTDQVDRLRQGTMTLRVTLMTGVGYMYQQIPNIVGDVFAWTVPVLVVVLCIAARRASHGWLWITFLVLPVAALLLTPAYFPYYNDFTAPGLALATAAAVRPRSTARSSERSTERSQRRRFAPAWIAVATVVAAGLLVADIALPRKMIKPYPVSALKPAVAQSRCVVSDSPMPLIMLGVLDRDLRRGCRNWIDVTGRSLGTLRTGSRLRPLNPQWQRQLARYLTAGDTRTIFRRYDTGIGPRLYRVLSRCSVLASSGGFTVCRVSPSGRRAARQLNWLGVKRSG
jgi:hypothetical protein